MPAAKKKNTNDSADLPIRVLIIDDDEAHGQTVAECLERAGSECTVAASGQQGAQLIESETYDVVITDLKMEGIDGLQILRKAKEELPDAGVILLTGHGSIQSAVTAMQHGAYTYLLKPLDVKELQDAVIHAADRLRLIRRNQELRRQLDERFGFEGIIGNSPQMQQVIERLKAVAPTDASCLITGENGTGKDLVARAIHQNSNRKSKPFVPINVAAIPETILESELFGHEPGSFTGATAKRIGKFEYANGGTLFLDEVGEMPLDTQVKLLRVLEDRKITRLGSNEEIPVNVRLIAATNADLKTMVEEKKFRIDLYHRLKVVSIRLPSLRERRGDITLLMDHFFRELSEKTGKECHGFSKAARQIMMKYHWPGNIRELRHTIEAMLILDVDGLLDVDDLPMELRESVQGESDDTPLEQAVGTEHLIGQTLEDVERYYIERALELAEGNRQEAANTLGISERTLYRKIKDYGAEGVKP